MRKKHLCINCGKSCHHQAKRCRKCQDKKHSEMMKGIGNCHYIDGRTLKQYYCKDCGEIIGYKNIRCQSCENRKRFKGKTYEEIMGIEKAILLKQKRKKAILGIKRSKETKRKLSLVKGGTGIPYESNEYGAGFDNALKEQVRFRDKYKCRECGCSQVENGKQLDCHHVDYNKKNNDINNLIALCISCHRKTNTKRNYWQQYFLKEVKI